MRIGHDAPSCHWLQQAEFSEVYLVSITNGQAIPVAGSVEEARYGNRMLLRFGNVTRTRLARKI